MKFLEIPELIHFTALLDGSVLPDSSRVRAKIEAYSCKAAGTDKKLSKALEAKYLGMLASEDLSPSPSRDCPLLPGSPTSPSMMAQSPFGPLGLASSRRTLIHLIATLNAAFPDSEFSGLRPDDFVKETEFGLVRNSVDVRLEPALGKLQLGGLWSAVDTAIDIQL